MALSQSVVRRLLFLIAIAASASAVAVAPAAPASQPNGSAFGSAPAQQSAPVAVLKTCGGGYTRGVISGQVKCLRAGEFCAHRYDRQYRRYGYRCIRYDASVQRYRLTRI
jgi:hypothetical protein